MFFLCYSIRVASTFKSDLIESNSHMSPLSESPKIYDYCIYCRVKINERV